MSDTLESNPNSFHMHNLNESSKICYSLESEIGEEEGSELEGSVNNYSLKMVDQAFIQIKYINVHRINLMNLRNITQCSGKLYINFNKFETSKVSIYLK